MKTPALVFILLAALSAVAGKDPTIGEYSDGVRTRVIAKVKEALADGGKTAEVSGVITYSGNGFFFVQSGGDGMKVFASGSRPSVGTEVRVSGVPSLEGGRIVFVSRKWTRIGSRPVPEARAVSAAELVDADESRPGVNGLRVVVEGRAIGVTESGFAVNVGDVPVNVMIAPLPDFLADCEKTHPKVKITGIAELMVDSSALLGREAYVMGVKLDVAASKDVELLTDLSYLAARKDRMLSLVGLGLILLLAGGIITFAVVIFRQRKGLFRTRTIMAERRRMADDIHDTIEQHLVGAGMLLKINRIQEAQDVLVRAKSEIRDIVWGLKNDDMMRLSPAEMLRKLAHDENIKGIYRVDTKLDGLSAQMDAAQMRDLSLIVRETIGNAVKHGGAKHIAISSDPLENGGWILRISNDGAPFDPATAPGAKEGHFGIEGMKQRARRLNATVTFEPRGKGMVMTLTSNMV